MKKIMQIFSVVSVLSGALLLYGSCVFAGGQYDLKEMTPEVQAALDNRRDRFEQLRELKAKGIVGENNRGYVEALEGDPQAESVVQAENRDRRIVYTTVEKQNNLTDALSTIEKVFAQVQREKSQPGEKIQSEDGTWVTK